MWKMCFGFLDTFYGDWIFKTKTLPFCLRVSVSPSLLPFPSFLPLPFFLPPLLVVIRHVSVTAGNARITISRECWIWDGLGEQPSYFQLWSKCISRAMAGLNGWVCEQGLSGSQCLPLLPVPLDYYSHTSAAGCVCVFWRKENSGAFVKFHNHLTNEETEG